MEKNYKFSQKQHAKNAIWSLFRKFAIQLTPILGLLVGFVIFRSREAMGAGFALGLILGIAVWWFIPKGKSAMLEVEGE